MVAFALRAEGWYLRSDIVWSKPSPMPESVKDRPTRSHEQVWMMTKQGKYYWDQDAVREDASTPLDSSAAQSFGSDKKLNNGAKAHTNRHGKKYRLERSSFRNIRDVWTIATEPTPEAHFATWPSALVERMIRAATSHKTCPKCAAPWGRITEKSRTFESGSGKAGHMPVVPSIGNTPKLHDKALPYQV